MYGLRFRDLMGIGLIAINLASYFVMLSSLELIGDVSGFPVQNINHLHLAVVMVVLTMLFFLFYYFNFLISLKVRSVKFKDISCIGNRMGLVILTLQVLFLFFNFIYGVNVSGSGNTSTSSVFSIFWVFVSPDLLFLIYYGFYRDSKLFKVNLTIAIISSLARGRGGIVLLFLFLELSRLVRGKQISTIKLLTISGIAILCYPFLNILKFTIRLFLGDGTINSLGYYYINVYQNILDGGYFNAVITGVEHIVGRLQMVSIVIEICRLSDVLMEGYNNGKFFGFWEEGLHGIVFDRLIGESRNVPLGTFLTSVGNFNWDFVVGDWNTNPGIAGWLLLNPLWSGMFLLYVGFLCFLSIFLIKLIGQTDMSYDMAWFAWAFYLMPGWLAVFFLFVCSLFIFLLIKVFLSSVPSITILKYSG